MSESKDRAQTIFLNALEMSNDEERLAYVSSECRDDAGLRQEVEDLLAHAQKLGRFMENREDVGQATFVPPLTEQPGDVIGPYKLLQQIGEGGMGVVYMAEQKEPVKRRVALKIIKPGMDTRQVIARFEAERQALAMMDHPNIAKVHDAGTTETGRPYFVMELVNGIPLTDFCDEHRLTPKERLALFIPVCQAIQHAHQKGIIHRDLKPGNILVAEYDHKAVPKVIDFGVAKATSQTLTEKTMFTQLGQIVGTLDYMSPEQAKRNQLDVDTRSDIYSLGVVLYELLTGETPFDKQRLRSAAFDEMLRIIREEEPPKPSIKLSSGESLANTAVNRKTEPKKLSLLVRGDLDWIIMKALEKDRNRRYETATSFANDIQHYLSDEPVTACPPSAAYKFRKFARRNKAVIGTAAAIAVSLIAGMISTSWQAYRATKAEGIAAERLSIVESQKSEIEKEKQLAVAAATRADAEATKAKSEAKRADQEAEKAKTEAAISKAVNEFLHGDLLGMGDAASQADAGLTPDPNIRLRTLLDRAVEKIEGRFSDQPLVEAAIRHTIGSTYSGIGAYHEAEKQLQRALELRRQHLGGEDAKTLDSMINLAIVFHDQGRYAEAEKLYQQTMEISKRTCGDKNRETLDIMNNLAIIYFDQGRFTEAESLHQQTLEIQRKTLGEEHSSTLISTINLANVYLRLGRYPAAEQLYEHVLRVRRQFYSDDHPLTLQSMMALAQAYQYEQRFAEAETLSRQALEIQSRTLGEEHPHTLATMNTLANVYNDEQKYADAEKLHRHQLVIRERTLGVEHPITLINMSNLANVYLNQRRYAEAEELDKQTLEIQRRVLGEEHPDTLRSVNNLAAVYWAQGRETEAEQLFRQALEILQRMQGEDFPLTKTVKGNLTSLCSNRAWALATSPKLEDRDPAEAVRLAQQAVDLFPDIANNWDNLGVALCSHQEYERAVETLEKARQMRGGTDKFRQIFLAMSYWKTGRRDEALAEYLQNANWLDNKRRPAEQYRFRDEAEEIIGTEAITELLDRKVAEHLDDPYAYQVRATFYERRQQFDQAANDYLQAFDLMIASDDSKPNPWWGPQKELAVELAEKPEIDRRLQQLRPDDVSLKIGRFRAHAIHERWGQAESLLEELTAAFPKDAHTWQLLAAVKYQQGDVSGYRELCKLLLDRFANHNWMPGYERTVRICLFNPDLMQDRQDQLHDMIEAALAKSEEYPGHYHQWFPLTRGLLAYREGQYDTVSQWLEGARKNKGLYRDVADLLLAMTEYQTDQREQARQHYDEAVANLEQSVPVQGSFNRRFQSLDILTAEVLRREAQALIIGESSSLVAPRPKLENNENTKVLVGETAEPAPQN